jgi:hypothetical protein
MFFSNYSFFIRNISLHMGSINDNYSVKNYNYSVQNDHYLVKKCLIFSEYFEIHQIVKSFRSSFMVNLNSVFANKYGKIRCQPQNYNVDWEIMIINENFGIVWSQFFPELLIFVYIQSYLKTFGLLVFGFDLSDKLQLGIRSLSNIQTIWTHIRYLNLMVK